MAAEDVGAAVVEWDIKRDRLVERDFLVNPLT
jgi:hypothetical protein